MERELYELLQPYVAEPLLPPPAGQTHEQQSNLEASVLQYVMSLEGYHGPYDE